MNDRQENKHTRNTAVDTLLDQNSSVIASISDFVNAAAALKAKNAEVNALRLIQEAPTVGPATDKAHAETTAITNVMILVSIMKGNAQLNNNATLLGSVNYTKSALEALRDTTLDVVLKNLNQIATDNLSDGFKFSGSGMTADMITASAASTAAYEALITAPRLKIDARSSATQLIPGKLADADKLIDIIKNFAGQFAASNPDFRNKIISACEIIDLGKNNPTPPATPPAPGS